MQTEQQFYDWLVAQGLQREEWELSFGLAKKGIEQSMLTIALLYKEHQNFLEASVWLNKTVLLGNIKAMYELGNVYFELDDEANAFAMYKEAAELGHPDAMNNLADMYLNGEGTARNEQLALKWFTKAAEHDVVEAMYTLGIMYEQGIGTEVNEKTALMFYEKAANLGDAEAQYRMGMIYFEGELGQASHIEQAIHYFKLAALQYHVDALFNLGYIIELEQGLNIDALHYYKQASLIGDIESTKKLVQYYAQLGDEQVQKWREKLAQLHRERE